jgi:hypothetical protein
MPTNDLLRYLDTFSKVVVPNEMATLIQQYTQAYGKVKVGVQNANIVAHSMAHVLLIQSHQYHHSLSCSVAGILSSLEMPKHFKR